MTEPNQATGGTISTMSSDTKTLTVIVGTIIGTAIAMTTVITTSLGGRMTSIEGRMTNLENELRATRTELREEIRATRDELREEIRALDTRVRTVETGFARIDQRLETIEHVVIPAAEPPQ